MADSATAADRIETFWTWWRTEGAAAALAAIEARDLEDLGGRLTERVHAIDDGLAWELGAGVGSDHALTVTAAGNPDLRAVARRWLRAAPPADGTWSYTDAREPMPDVTDVLLTLGEHDQLALGEIRVAPQRNGNLLDVVLQHPRFADLDEQSAMQVAFLALDSALGEMAVETWLGQVETRSAPLDGDVALADLPGHQAALVADCTTEDGEPSWVLLQGTGPDGPLMAAAQVPLAAAYAPHLDRHVGVRVPYGDRDDQGMPTEAGLSLLRSFEDHLSERVGESGRLVAHETAGGLRTLHYYVESTGPGDGVLAAATAGWEQGPVEVQPTDDPAWREVAHLRV